MGFCFCSVFLFGVAMEARGWYDNPQPALRPVLAQCATPCVCWGVCMYGWCAANVILTMHV